MALGPNGTPSPTHAPFALAVADHLGLPAWHLGLRKETDLMSDNFATHAVGLGHRLWRDGARRHPDQRQRDQLAVGGVGRHRTLWNRFGSGTEFMDQWPCGADCLLGADGVDLDRRWRQL
jgi:hypothetical protein